MNIRTSLRVHLILACSLSVAPVCFADTNLVLTNPNLGEAGMLFAYANDPEWAYATLSYDSAADTAGGALLGRSHVYIFRPWQRDAVRLFMADNGLHGTATKPGGGKWGSLSDRRVKKDIHAFTPGLAELEKITPRQFKYNGVSKMGPDNGAEFIGLIAQETQPVLPMMVHKMPGETINGTPALGMDTSALTYVLINAVKQQAEMIRQLDGEARELERLVCNRYRDLALCTPGRR